MVKNILSYFWYFSFLFFYCDISIVNLYLPTEDGSIVVPIAIAPAYQSYVDDNEVVQDNELFSTENNILLFGHNYKTFSCLEDIIVGDTITLWNNYVPTNYTVSSCARGRLNKYNTDILDNSTGDSLLFSNYEDSNVIRLITCEGLLDPNGRIVIIAEAEVETMFD